MSPGVEIIGDLTEWLKMKSAAKFHSNLNPVELLSQRTTMWDSSKTLNKILLSGTQRLFI
ncbi:MAG: hypothetical protein ABSB81_11580 [Halobacteriota archaeon]|jgi:hypothetical protein